MTTTSYAPIIVTDGTCDLPAAAFAHYTIHMIPLRIHFGADEVYLSDEDMALDQFFERLRQDDVHPTTSAPTEADFLTLYQQLIARYGDRPILSIHLSGRLSQTVIHARRAARQLHGHRIEVWDSQMVAGGLGLQVLAAAQAAEKEYSIAQITTLLQDTYAASEYYFCLDDLSYLYRGGRIGRVSYTVAQALRLKPVIMVSKEGETRGTYISGPERSHSLRGAVDAFVRAAAKSVSGRDPLRVLITHGEAESTALAHELAEKMHERFNCVYLAMGQHRPALAVHVGDKALALAFAVGDWTV